MLRIQLIEPVTPSWHDPARRRPRYHRYGWFSVLL